MSDQRMIIGKRTLRRPDGGRNVTVTLFLPEEEGGGFRCYYKIEGLDKEHLFFGAGIDGIQALQIALQNIGAELFLKYQDVKLTFGDLDDPGFPRPSF
jgi:uncharacterized protein DUF6968